MGDTDVVDVGFNVAKVGHERRVVFDAAAAACNAVQFEDGKPVFGGDFNFDRLNFDCEAAVFFDAVSAFQRGDGDGGAAASFLSVAVKVKGSTARLRSKMPSGMGLHVVAHSSSGL